VQALVRAARALSDETRVRILNLLLERECCVCEVMQALQISQSRASRNLGILSNAGFLSTRRDGPWVLYSVDARSDNRVAVAFTSVLGSSLAADDTLRQDRERLRHSVRVGPGCGRE